ncbi:DUF2837 family protein [bacterium]|nr:DUF2837 family protein [bacterium]
MNGIQVLLNLHLLSDPRLCFVVVISGLVSMLGSLNIASRPAAVITGKVAQATTISSIFFMISRLANMFYLPLMAGFVGEAVRTGDTTQLLQQIQLVVFGSAMGSLASFLLLPNFVNLFCYLVEQLDRQGIKSFVRPSIIVKAAEKFAGRYPLKARLGDLAGIPVSFLLFNVFATAVWTIGALSAVYCSGAKPEYSSTALLLSGLVNAFAAIAFSIWVDPQAAIITTKVIKQERPAEQVYATALHLGLGNFVGGMLGLVVLHLGIYIIMNATVAIGAGGAQMAGGIWMIVALNAALTVLASTTYASRVSAVVTRNVAVALAVYNLFFLVTRLSQQFYSPLLGSTADHLVKEHQVEQLEALFRWVLAGASLGSFLGLLLLPTFVEVINKAIAQIDRHQSVPKVLGLCLVPANWPAIASCLRPPGLLGVGLSDLKQLPGFFLIGNVVVLSIHSMGTMAAICAGAQLHDNPGAARSATLLSSVVNGVATIMLSLVVDPTLARITDQCVDGKRLNTHVRAAAVFLLLGMLLGTLVSQLIFTPAIWFIKFCAVDLINVLRAVK